MITCAPRFHIKINIENTQAVSLLKDKTKIFELIKKINEKFMA